MPSLDVMNMLIQDSIIVEGIAVTLGIGALIAGIAAAAGTAYAANKNAQSIADTNAQNKAINQQNLDYNTAQTQAQWERDDTAHQREVADLKAAGLSPLANLTGSQSSSPLGAPNPIAMQAPQIDTNAIVQAALGSAQIEEQKREFNVSAGQKDMDIKNEADRIKVEADKVKFDNEHNQRMYEIAVQSNSLRSKEIENFSRELKETERYNSEEQRRKEKERLFNEYHTRFMDMYERMKKECPEYCSGVKPCFNDSDLEQAQTTYNYYLDKLTKELGSIKNADGSLYTDVGGKLAGGTGELLPGVKGEINGDINAGVKYDNDKKREAIIQKYKAYLKFPMPISKDDRDLFDDNGHLKTKR